jgi:hypothetical protein
MAAGTHRLNSSAKVAAATHTDRFMNFLLRLLETDQLPQKCRRDTWED